MLVPNQASHIKKPLDPAFSLLKQDHKLLGFPVLSFEATWLEDVLQGFYCCKLESLVLANVIPVEAREHIILSKFVAVFGKQIVLQIAFFGSHLPIDYWLGLRQRFSEWSFFIYNLIRYWPGRPSWLFLQLRFNFLNLCTDVRITWLWVHNIHLCLVLFFFLLIVVWWIKAGVKKASRLGALSLWLDQQVLDPLQIRGAEHCKWLSWFNSHQ